ncbi:MAG: TonB family protein [Alphaproteobacteria bacterium]|nr:TonB family protein [Alphaproteobacteria bacterium]
MTSEAVFPRAHLQPLPLAAVALAMLLHLGTGAALWWISPDKPADAEDEPIMLLFDSSPSNTGLQQPERIGPPSQSIAAAAQGASHPPAAEPERAPATPQATVAPQASLPVFEFSIPPVTEPPPAPTARDFIRPARPPQRLAQRLPALPQPRPSAQQRPPAEMPAAMPSPIPGPEPADVLAGRGRQRNDYLTRLFRHLEPYRFDPAKGRQQHGRVVTRVTLARDGRVLEVDIASSSGSAALDAAEVAAIRKGSPFPPLPAAMPGDPVVLVLPITY